MGRLDGFVYGGHINWFTGHMDKATHHIKHKLQFVDVVLEVRDARIPLSSANPALEEVVGNKRRVVVFNKCDLANVHLEQKVRWHLGQHRRPPECVFTSTTTGRNVNKVIAAALGDAPLSSSRPLLMMTVGLPNVGKSSLINALRRRHNAGSGKAAKVEAKPGLTQHLSCFAVCHQPRAFLVDSPGVMFPRVQDNTHGLKLGLAGVMDDKRVGVDVLADFALFALNRTSPKAYMAWLGVDEPVPDVAVLEELMGQRFGKKREHVVQFLARFWAGDFGRLTLDDV